jgi:hypothetical protein
MAMSTWRGEGILRIAPVGMPWSIWLFWELVAAVTQGRFTADVERGLSMPHPTTHPSGEVLDGRHRSDACWSCRNGFNVGLPSQDT